MVCTVDCLSKYGCNELVLPQDGAIYSPFVELRFGKEVGGPNILTVGNSSSPPDNHAAIKSFDYGFTEGQTGVGFKMEILDQGGITYRRILEAINKTTFSALDDTLNCSVRFGWITTKCDGSSSLVTNEDSGDKLYFLPVQMKAQFENGLIKFSFEGGSMVTRWAETRVTKTLGSQKNKMPLKQALKILFTEYDPKVKDVIFRNKDGGELCFPNSDGGCDGPRGVWPMDQQNALAIARKWLSAIRTKDKLGILMLYDPTGPYVIFQENPDSTDTTDCCKNNLGTYIVNGSNCSPVISFNPNMNWVKGMLPAGGGSMPGAASGNNKVLIHPTKKIEKVGTQTGPTVQQHEWMWRNPDDMALKNADAIAAHLEANLKYEQPLPNMQAELKIIGRPDLGDPIQLVGKSVSIIVINPFYISTQNCSWITTSNCNKVFSNKRWFITAASHQISNGSYVTTLQVQLTVPNISGNASDPLGGIGCGTEKFENSKPGEPNGT